MVAFKERLPLSAVGVGLCPLLVTRSSRQRTARFPPWYPPRSAATEALRGSQTCSGHKRSAREHTAPRVAEAPTHHPPPDRSFLGTPGREEWPVYAAMAIDRRWAGAGRQSRRRKPSRSVSTIVHFAASPMVERWAMMAEPLLLAVKVVPPLWPSARRARAPSRKGWRERATQRPQGSVAS